MTLAWLSVGVVVGKLIPVILLYHYFWEIGLYNYSGFIWKTQLFIHSLTIPMRALHNKKRKNLINFQEEIRLGRNHEGTNSVDISMCSVESTYIEHVKSGGSVLKLNGPSRKYRSGSDIYSLFIHKIFQKYWNICNFLILSYEFWRKKIDY